MIFLLLGIQIYKLIVSTLTLLRSKYFESTFFILLDGKGCAAEVELGPLTLINQFSVEINVDGRGSAKDLVLRFQVNWLANSKVQDGIMSVRDLL